MQGLIDNLMALGRQRLLILAGTAVGVILAMLLGLNAVATPDYAPIYSNLSVTSANSIEATLANAGFKVSVSEDGSSVSVPRPDAARARMVLAESGVAIDGDPGWELFDEKSGLAMNSFLQKINRMRAMEGELARSIQTIDGISTARVHLVLPDREPFSREAPAPRASIIVRPEPGRAVTRKQAVAVRTLVASAVAELDLARVTVLSASGETILAEGTDGNGQATIQSAKAGIEDRLGQEIQNILTARVGAGNARVRVNVELVTQREVIVEQTFDPDQQVVRSTENKSESQSGTEDGGNVGIENNIPAALGGEGGGATSNRSESDELVQYEIGNTRREIIREAGDVRRMTVAVLINGIYNVDGSDVTYAERSPEELNRLTELVKSAVGFQENRGDSVSVDSMRFMDYSMDLGDPVEMSLMDNLSENIVTIIRSVMALLIVGLIMVMGVRPILRRLNPPEQLEADPETTGGAPALAAGETDDIDALPAGTAGMQALPNGETPAATTALPGTARTAANGVDARDLLNEDYDDEEDQEYVEKQGIRGNLRKKKIDNIQRLADEKPEEVLRVLRSWLMTEAEA
ncbi:flagellar M-ring protein FliF [Sulfitobacter mediterraneus]|uniref:flagellar basal-body MS-ring/collar protein FliF n=1 Tax=Sulfitobacter mediterraneus TaxID=83219 RepID=UPI0019336275|nr:flagellar basal-body MS-ring/collar protein FliF [Sulfitobacter mediterraneus]MBM1312065.1 flagellar M-ring protein FliF [Sulfitobacter mediterraneus]MBM1315945.1 flagellar M-ring protein FliF [Sulfitobacter mediterraneus]MBM1324308.1 flagellar M-ring protein FliF [Sulfitobacter mediterraneus]MBM1328219.1 flagellar M-ring protein FliF [Sulfitobacter mediterraneus]MBM1399568.1 flagellar M-ring protein FliF [Sulfitobacter mediterraneus]